MWRRYLSFIIISVFVIGYLVYKNNETRNLYFSKSSVPDYPFPRISSEILLGSAINQKAKGYVVHLWATWCITCKKGMPALLQAAKKFSNLYFYLISEDENDLVVKKYFKKMNMSFPENLSVIRDKDNSIKFRLGVSKFPESFVYTSNKKFIQHYIGEEITSNKGLKLLKKMQ